MISGFKPMRSAPVDSDWFSHSRSSSTRRMKCSTSRLRIIGLWHTQKSATCSTRPRVSDADANRGKCMRMHQTQNYHCGRSGLGHSWWRICLDGVCVLTTGVRFARCGATLHSDRVSEGGWPRTRVSKIFRFSVWESSPLLGFYPNAERKHIHAISLYLGLPEDLFRVNKFYF